MVELETKGAEETTTMRKIQWKRIEEKLSQVLEHTYVRMTLHVRHDVDDDPNVDTSYVKSIPLRQNASHF